MREKIRAELGMGAYAILSLPKVKKALENSDVVLVESLYSWDEYKIMKNEFNGSFEVIAVFGPPTLRFPRLIARKNWRPMNGYEEFKRRDWTEIEGTDKGGPIAIADHTLLNTSSLENLHEQIEKIILIDEN